MYTTDMYQGLLAETVTVTGASGDQINAFWHDRSDRFLPRDGARAPHARLG